MDYTPINLAAKGSTQGKYFADAPGSYDIWAIQFGYDPDMQGEKREAHLKRSLEPLLTFGNDADDMRSAGKAIDPRVNVGDLSGDTLAWSEQRLDLVAETMSNLYTVSLKDDESFQRRSTISTFCCGKSPLSEGLYLATWVVCTLNVVPLNSSKTSNPIRQYPKILK